MSNMEHAEKHTTVRNIAVPKAIHGRMPCRYPIIRLFFTGEPE